MVGLVFQDAPGQGDGIPNPNVPLLLSGLTPKMLSSRGANITVDVVLSICTHLVNGMEVLYHIHLRE